MVLFSSDVILTFNLLYNWKRDAIATLFHRERQRRYRCRAQTWCDVAPIA
jgi:hypothetical protein